ncbi:MAG: IS110 family transposase [Propionibacteriaceae bacterium]
MTVEYAVSGGVDLRKEAHPGCALNQVGWRVVDAVRPHDEAHLRGLFTRPGEHGPVLVVVDQPNTDRCAADRSRVGNGAQVAYLPGLAVRRIAVLHRASASWPWPS